MKKGMLLTICAVVFLLAVDFSRVAPDSPVHLTIFAFDGCGGCFGDGAPCQPCTVLDGLYTDYYEILEREGLTEGAKIEIYNTKEERGRTRLREACEERGLAQGALAMPVVILDGEAVFSGERAAAGVIEALRARRGLPAESPGEALDLPDGMVYFSSELCGECVRARGYIDEALPALAADGIPFTEYDVDAEQNYALLRQVMAGHGIGHESAVVPYLFWEGESYYGSDAIGAALAPWRENRE